MDKTDKNTDETQKTEPSPGSTGPDNPARSGNDKNRSQFYILIWPPVLFVLVFFIDKIFLLPAVLDYTIPWQKIEPVFYESRFDLFEQLKADYNQRGEEEKLGLILGTSRAGEFSTERIEKLRPNRYTYNFSAPLAAPSYHYYWLDRILSEGFNIDFVLLEIDPVLVGRRSIDFSLYYSYDWRFVVENTDWYGRTEIRKDPYDVEGTGFSFDEAESFFLRRAFAMYRYPVEYSVIQENISEIVIPDEEQVFVSMQKREFRNQLAEMIPQANQKNLGGIPNPLFFEVPETELAKDAENLLSIHFPETEPETTQIIFFRRILKTLAERGIRTMVYWPVTSRPFREGLEEMRLIEYHQSRIKTIIANLDSLHDANITFHDPYNDDRLSCRAFVDSVHLSGACFEQLESILFLD